MSIDQARINENLHRQMDVLQERVIVLEAEAEAFKEQIRQLEGRLGNHANWLSDLASEFHNYKDRNPGRSI
jgi:chaperonin cofactor prefoldin